MASRPVVNFITGNKNKLAEVKAILEPVIEVRSQAVDLVEIQGTMEEVTLDKCRRAAAVVSPGASPRSLLAARVMGVLMSDTATRWPCLPDPGPRPRRGHLSLLQRARRPPGTRTCERASDIGGGAPVGLTAARSKWFMGSIGHEGPEQPARRIPGQVRQGRVHLWLRAGPRTRAAGCSRASPRWVVVVAGRGLFACPVLCQADSKHPGQHRAREGAQQTLVRAAALLLDPC